MKVIINRDIKRMVKRIREKEVGWLKKEIMRQLQYKIWVMQNCIESNGK